MPGKRVVRRRMVRKRAAAKPVVEEVVEVEEEQQEEQQEDQPETEPEDESEEEEEETQSRKRLWDDDETAKSNKKRAFDWAAVEKPEADDDSASEISDEEDMKAVMQTTDSMVDRTKALPAGTLDYQLLQDGNKNEYSEAALSAVNFHPSGNILLTASPDYRLRLFQTDGTTSTKLQTIRFKDMPLRNAKFSPDGTKILCTAARPYYSIVDVESVKINMIKGFGQPERNLSVFAFSPHENTVAFASQTGATHVVSMATQTTKFTVKGDGPCNAVCFHPTDPTQLFTSGGSKVYVWDARTTRRPLRIHQDEGSREITSLDVTFGKYAVGSSNGVVNVYDLPSVWPTDPLSLAPAPRKSIMSLVTEATFAEFNPTGDILCVGSMKKKNAARLVHVPTLTTFSNFPRVNHYYRKVTCMAFSPSSGMLCMGNDRGRAMLFRLSYYGSA